MIKGVNIYILILAIFLANFTPIDAKAKMFGTDETKSTDIKSFTKWEAVVDRHNAELKKNSKEIQNWKKQVSKLKASSKKSTLVAVNEYFNDQIKYRNDSKVWGKSDYWASPLETVGKGFGDCDDYAIAKYFALKQLGFKERDMRMVILKDKQKNQIHAVLAVREAGKFYILDNQLAKATPDYQISYYEPIYSINTSSWWKHRA